MVPFAQNEPIVVYRRYYVLWIQLWIIVFVDQLSKFLTFYYKRGHT